MRRHERRDLGRLIVGLVILGIGSYYLLTKTLGLTLPELDWDLIWPILVIGLGVAIVYEATKETIGSGQH